jgi:ArsR family transcriptional regulator
MCKGEYVARVPRATRSIGRSRIDLMFRAFSDRTRLRILHLLQDGEVCVGDLVGVLRLPQPTVSRHLAYLRRAGMVHVRKDGLWVFYGLAVPATAFHEKLLACLGACFADVPEIARDAKRAGRRKSSGSRRPR